MQILQNTDKIVGSIYQTKNYAQFRAIEGNRKVNGDHVKRIMDSMNIQQLIVPIIVNEQLQIIDGQHRYMAAKALNLPICYIVLEGYALPHVHRLNSNTSNWKGRDYIQGYVDMGKESYITFQNFLTTHGLPNNTTFELMGISNATNIRNFREGNYVTNDENQKCAEVVALWIKAIQPIYKDSHRIAFVRALKKAYGTTFDITHFVHKASNYGKAEYLLTNAQSTKQTIKAMQDIYNWHTTLDKTIQLVF